MQPPTLPRYWFLHSRTFWLGLLVTAFFTWLTIDSHLNTSIIRTIHRGSLRDWSNESSFPPGTPDESGSLMLGLGGGAVSISWLDQLGDNADYSGNDERGKADPELRKVWLPRISSTKDSVMRIREACLPTWLILATWLGIWGWQLAKSRRRHRAHLTPGGLAAS